jgi:Family of unknown function (DUF5719)
VSRPRYRRLIFAAVVALVLAGIYGAAGARHPAAAAGKLARPTRAEVSMATRVCPAPGSPAPTAASVAAAALPASSAPGAAVISTLTPGGRSSASSPAATADKPGVLQVVRIKTAARLSAAEKAGQPGSSPSVTTQAGRGGVEVNATGAMAQGLEVEQTTTSGVVTAQCSAPGTDFWFVGPGQALAGTIELYLMNTGSQPADAQVTALTDVTNGPPLLGNADNGITVPPHGMVMQSLSRLLRGSKVTALNVTTSVGQVAVAVRESRSAGNAGIWLPATQAPAQHLVIPGLPRAGGKRQLYLAAPGSAAAQVKVTAVTPRGSYQPTGGSNIPLLGGSVTSIALPSLSGVPGAISISSSVPVVAAELVSGGPPGTPGALAASSGPVLEQGVLAANPARSAGSTQLVLSAPGKAASVRISTATTSISAVGQQGSVVQIKAGSSVVITAKPPTGSKATEFTLVVTPVSGSGPVYAGRIITIGSKVQSVLPVPSSLTWIPLPDVQSSLSAISASGHSSAG